MEIEREADRSQPDEHPCGYEHVWVDHRGLEHERRQEETRECGENREQGHPVGEGKRPAPYEGEQTHLAENAEADESQPGHDEARRQVVRLAIEGEQDDPPDHAERSHDDHEPGPDDPIPFAVRVLHLAEDAPGPTRSGSCRSTARPATTWPTVNRPGVVDMARLSIEKDHATIASTTGIAPSTSTAARGKAAGGTRRSPSADCEFSGMSENLVEAVATVATQPLINPSPKTT